MSQFDELVDIVGERGQIPPEQPHAPVVLLLDTSGSMNESDGSLGRKIDQLIEGINYFKEDILNDDLAKIRVDLAVVSFGQSVSINQSFSSVQCLEPGLLSANGSTPMGEAILKAAEMVETRKSEYRAMGIDYYRPWIFMITDGEPTDMRSGDAMWNNVVNTINQGIQQRKFAFFPVAVQPANLDVLNGLYKHTAQLKPGCFKELFKWLSNSLSGMSRANIGDTVQQEDTSPWMVVETQ